MTQLTIQDLYDLRYNLGLVTNRFTSDRRTKLDEKLKRIISEREEFEQRQKEEEERRSQAVPLKVPHWGGVSPGTLVKRSDCYIKECCFSDHSRGIASKQTGIVSKIDLYSDDICGSVAFPIIHWEKEHSPKTCHPLHAQLANGGKLPIITMNANQQHEKE